MPSGGQTSSPTSRPPAYAKDLVEHLTATWRRDTVRDASTSISTTHDAVTCT
ncbi:hypothetical protein ACWIGX_19145 [Streptomyces nigrescens]